MDYCIKTVALVICFPSFKGDEASCILHQLQLHQVS